MHIGGINIIVRRIPDGFSISQNDHLWSFVPDTRQRSRASREISRADWTTRMFT